MSISTGELNILDIYCWNKVALFKLLWAITTKNDTLWIQWIHSFYVKNRSAENMSSPKQACWIIRNIFDARDWFSQNNPTNDLNSYCKKEKFSIKKLYIASKPQYQKCPWKRLTIASKALPKQHFILWLALHRRLATIERLQKWGISMSKECVLCQKNIEETKEHLLFEWEYSRILWAKLLQWTGIKTPDRKPGRGDRLDNKKSCKQSQGRDISILICNSGISCMG